MSEQAMTEFHRRYSRMFGVVAGYLPEEPAVVHRWHSNLVTWLESARAGAAERYHDPAVQALSDLINRNGIVRMYLTDAIEQAKSIPPISEGKPNTIQSIDQLLSALDHIVTLAPEFEPDPRRRNFFPMSTLFVYMMATPAGSAAFRNPSINAALTAILKQWCAYLDSPKSRSVLNEAPNGWLSMPAQGLMRLDEFVIPDRSAPAWGWSSYNDFFHREIKPEKRPLGGQGDPSVVVSPNDGTMYNIARSVQAVDKFWMKGQPYSLADMLNGKEVGRFVGGDVFQSFLSGANYHRFRSPIDGRVISAEVISGLTFSETSGWDPDAGVLSLGYDATVNTRGLLFIDSGSPTLGTVCVIPIGITEISSVTWFVEPGQVVRKGDPLGWFSFGGSTLAVVFQPGAIERYLVQEPLYGKEPPYGYGKEPPSINVNAPIARVKQKA
ncbi:phosphatidylserine decarboxylase family protein [Sorangium sp. So ce367]|uniref:phosphatidylserine decarboxylase family protein n=1 Tax=Sorangium sp. So ce367 TaxID=3133305 RepID=UPI003F5DFA72